MAKSNKRNQRQTTTKSTQNTDKSIQETENVVSQFKSASINQMIDKKEGLAFDRSNYLIMIGGIVMLVIGLVIMSLDNEPFGFGFLGLTLGPMIVLSSFIVQFFAIFYTPKK